VNKVTVPVNAMLFRAEGPRLAVVDENHKIQLRPINIGRDYGTSLEILGGVSTEDNIVINPPDSLQEGQGVNIASVQPGQQEPPQGVRQKEDAPQRRQGEQQKGSQR
jgi:hypothetical protein